MHSKLFPNQLGTDGLTYQGNIEYSASSTLITVFIQSTLKSHTKKSVTTKKCPPKLAPSLSPFLQENA